MRIAEHGGSLSLKVSLAVEGDRQTNCRNHHDPSAAQRGTDQFCRSSDRSREREKRTEILGRAHAGKNSPGTLLCR